MKYVIRDSESGIVFDMFEEREEAEAALKEYEKADKEDGLYVKDAYEITEE